MKFTASQLVAFAQKMVGQPYWYGTCVYACTTDLLNRKTQQYPSYYTSDRMNRYKQDVENGRVCMDCVGMVKGFFWTNGGNDVIAYLKDGTPFKNAYGSNGCPDESADGFYNWCVSKGVEHGSMKTLPEQKGILLHAKGHVGIYIGGGTAIEARGFAYGVVKTAVSARSWTEWAYIPILEYDMPTNKRLEKIAATPIETPVEAIVETPVEKPKKTDTVVDLDSRKHREIIKRGMIGDDVRDVQRYLLATGYSLPKYGADGDCGPETEAAIKAFQKDHDLEVDGQFGPLSRAAMEEALNKAL